MLLLVFMFLFLCLLKNENGLCVSSVSAIKYTNSSKYVSSCAGSQT